MSHIRATFDGRVLVPKGPVELDVGQEVDLEMTPVGRDHSLPLLERLVRLAEGREIDPSVPTDGAAQHDHYLYGMPKRP